ncbi:hypothetical protein F4679DRAFT_54092 [Xylaria curta]|nr:hypothetical protein F4679DRAFT_54092 [Xylaria curta]
MTLVFPPLSVYHWVSVYFWLTFGASLLLYNPISFPSSLITASLFFSTSPGLILSLSGQLTTTAFPTHRLGISVLSAHQQTD